MVAYVTGLAVGFWLGWLARLWRTQAVRARRRPGYVTPPASSGTSQGMAAGRVTFSSLPPRLGLASEDKVLPVTQDETSSIAAPTVSGSGTDGLGTGPVRLVPADSAEGSELLRRNRKGAA